MSSLLLKAGRIVTMDSARRVITGGAVRIEGERIAAVLDAGELRSLHPAGGDVVDAPHAVIIPGFVQTHLHLCQTLFRGLADDLPLLDWLRLRIFPLEAAHTDFSMYASARAGLLELIGSGTTTIMDMGSVSHEEEIVRAISESGMRAFVGKALMDINDPYPPLREPTGVALRSAAAEARAYHGSAGGRILYAVAPRFILSCTDALLRDAAALAGEIPGALFHTHAAENSAERDAVRRRCGMENIEYFGRLGLLGERTCLAHCIWLEDRELDLLAEHSCRVLHCPSSNLKLGSGIARVPAMLQRGILVSLGADGAPCNNMLDMFEEMRLAALLQKPIHGAASMPAEEVFAMATVGGARTLGLFHDIGSIEPGKKADLAVLDLRRAWNPLQPETPADLYSAIVYSGRPANVDSVMIDGVWVYRGGGYTHLDPGRILEDARMELAKLLRRVEWAG
jgi:cytosine/adenosine deaminase-related metal-dependent hydrolase